MEQQVIPADKTKHTRQDVRGHIGAPLVRSSRLFAQDIVWKTFMIILFSLWASVMVEYAVSFCVQAMDYCEIPEFQTVK